MSVTCSVALVMHERALANTFVWLLTPSMAAERTLGNK